MRDSFTLAVNQLLRYHTRLLQYHPSRRVNVAPEQPDGLLQSPPKWIYSCDWQRCLAPNTSQDRPLIPFHWRFGGEEVLKKCKEDIELQGPCE